MKSRPPRSRQSLSDSLFGLGWHSGTAEGFAALVPLAAIYLRVSTDEQTTDNQERELRARCRLSAEGAVEERARSGSLGHAGAGAECSVRRSAMKCLLNIDRCE